MGVKTSFSRVKKWLGETEMFGRPSKKVPGNWQLYEYYMDASEGLLHFTTDKLKENEYFLYLYFFNDNTFKKDSNIDVGILQRAPQKEWSVSRNFITLINPNNFRDNVEFQFAFDNGNLKLLKKDSFGKIEFFGFFKKLN
jgi:hypothetical protein